jgi:hypothetical protein
MRVLCFGYGRVGKALEAISQNNWDIVFKDISSFPVPWEFKPHVILNLGPHHINKYVLNECRLRGLPYFDASEVVQSDPYYYSREILQVPHCGLAPGILAHLAKQWGHCKVYCGAIPYNNPGPPLYHKITWSPEGQVKEYGSLDYGYISTHNIRGTKYESYPTQGGLGTYTGGDYRTLRWPQHWFTIYRLQQDGWDLNEVFNMEQFKGATDKVVIRIEKYNDYCELVLTLGNFNDMLPHPETHSAIALATACGIAVALDAFKQGKLPSTGLFDYQDIDNNFFWSSKFTQPFKALRYDQGAN